MVKLTGEARPSRRSYRAAMYLANRMDETEEPCINCEGQGMMPSECVFTPPTWTCVVCLGTGVDLKTRAAKTGKD